MCGIGGIWDPRGRPAERDALHRMIGALDHRGPDERGLYRDAHASLVHTRLSIVDLHTGQQPMTDTTGRFWVVFNGEVFNYVELREQLRARGEQFRTESDTEVFLGAWKHWGIGAFDRIDGQWAAAIWDSQIRRLWLSRDPFGIVPLHWTEHDGRVIFASEVKAIFAAEPALARELDTEGLHQIFTFWSPLAPRTAFRTIRELEPGHVRIWDERGAIDAAWYEPRFPTERAEEASLDEAVETVRTRLSRAASSRVLRADVPVGSYLSGGLDSSLLVALAQGATGRRLHTFGIRFSDVLYDESDFQRLVASRLGSTHEEIEVTGRDVAEVFPDVVRHTERPVLRTAPAPLLLLSRAVRRAGIKVVLTGEGADEMFGGYDLFREGKIRRFWARHPESLLRPRALERLYPYLARSPVAHRALARAFFGRDLDRASEAGSTHQTRWRATSALLRLFAADVRARLATRDVVSPLLRSMPAASARWSPLARDQYLEIRTLLSGYLLSSQGDRMLMASSVEGRFPYLDPRVVALAAALPDVFKIRGLDEKHVLKQVARGLVPDVVARRPKQPYRAPDAGTFFGPDAPDWVGEVTSESRVRSAGVFDPQAVAQVVRKHRNGSHLSSPSNSDDMALSGVLSTQLLHEQLVVRAPDPAPPRHIETVIDRC